MFKYIVAMTAIVGTSMARGLGRLTELEMLDDLPVYAGCRLRHDLKNKNQSWKVRISRAVMMCEQEPVQEDGTSSTQCWTGIKRIMEHKKDINVRLQKGTVGNLSCNVENGQMLGEDRSMSIHFKEASMQFVEDALDFRGNQSVLDGDDGTSFVVSMDYVNDDNESVDLGCCPLRRVTKKSVEKWFDRWFNRMGLTPSSRIESARQSRMISKFGNVEPKKIEEEQTSEVETESEEVKEKTEPAEVLENFVDVTDTAEAPV